MEMLPILQKSECCQLDIKKTTEPEPEEGQKRYRALVETIPHGIQELDTKGTIIFANPAHARIYGYQPDAMIGKSILDQCADDEERRRVRDHLAFILDHQPHPTPWYGRDKTRDGRRIYTQVDWNYRRGADGEVVGFITVISEITHRKRAEKALLDNLTFMNTLIDTIPNPVFYKDRQGYFLGCNVAYAKTLGLTKKRILGHRLIDLETTLHSDMAEHYHRQDLLLIQNQGVQTHEEQIQCADGVLRIFELNKATFSDAENEVAGLVGIMLDITETKQALKDLKESKALFDAFMRHLPGLAFMKDPQGIYLYVNESFEQYTGLKTANQLGRRDDQIWDGATAAGLRANDQHVLTTQTPQSHAETIRLPDEQTRHLLTVRFPVFKDGRLFALGGISIDTTERTLAQRQREQLELQLQQAQKMEALGTLAGGIAHDFNNILAAIIGYTEIVAADSQTGTSAQHYLERVLEAGERARSLVKQILAFSRQGKMEPKPVQIKLIIKEVLKLLRASLPATIEIVQQIHSDGAVMADPTQLHQVMMNLGTNAGYAMGEKGGTLTVRLEEIELDAAMACNYGDLLPGAYLQLTVIDSGKGIAAKDMGRIFDPFFTTKPRGEGTGMGLSVVHGIVAGLGGAITVDSAPSQGARFDVYLPALHRDDGMVAEIGEKAPLPTGKERILFVDDEVFQTDMFKQMLGLLGYQVETCNNGAQALALFETDPQAFDLVITDMIMPGMTGDKVAGKILAVRPELPVILTTGYSEQMTEAGAKAIGIKAYALKPLVMEELARLIRRVLDNARKG